MRERERVGRNGRRAREKERESERGQGREGHQEQDLQGKG